MSGLIGFYNLKSPSRNLQSQEEIIKSMAEMIKHRGPDGAGYFMDHNLVLGHRLLKIPGRPVSPQPATFDNGRIVVMLDGEIYNWQEVLQELETEKIKLSNPSDAEIIAYAYKTWGAACLNHFNGGWAFVLFDKQKNLLLGGRDHFGIKPFYYHLDREKLIFASEMKAILAYPGMKAKPNDRIVWDFLIDDLLDHSTDTIFEGIKELWGGHYFILEKGRFKVEKYYFALDQVKQIKRNEATEIQEFKNLVEQAVKMRLPLEGPVAVSLSGGVDSSSMVMLNSQILPKTQKQHTFSARFKQKELDEHRFINEVVKKSRAKPHYLFPDGQGIVKDIKKILWHQEIPFSGTSIYAQWEVFKTIKKSGIKVLLEGVGADVLLAGYTGLIGIYIVDLAKKGKVWTALKELYYFHKLHGSLWALAQELFIKSVHFGLFGRAIAKLFEGKLWPEYRLVRPRYLAKYTSVTLKKYDPENIFNNGMVNNYFISLNPVLRFEDRNLNAFGISSRLPFIDHKIVEFGFALPDNVKIRDGQTKWILRQAMKGVLPEVIRSRHDKIGFGTPPKWLTQDLKDEMLKVFRSESFASRGYFDSEKTVGLFNQLIEGKIHHHHLFWRAYCLEIWFRTFIDQQEL